jgi:PAS domain-containing protein
MSFRWLPALLWLCAGLLLLTALVDLSPAWREAAVAAAVGCLLLALYFVRRLYARFTTLCEQLAEQRAEIESLQLELTRQQRRRLALIDGMPIPLLICDADAMLRYANRLALEWFGFRHMTGADLQLRFVPADAQSGAARVVRVGRTHLQFPQRATDRGVYLVPR